METVKESLLSIEKAMGLQVVFHPLHIPEDLI